MTIASRTREAHLIVLHGPIRPGQLEIDRVTEARKAQLGCPTRTLATLPVTGPMPTAPDSYVIAVALMACKQAGVPFDSDRGDQIAFQRAGITGELGLITVLVNH